MRRFSAGIDCKMPLRDLSGSLAATFFSRPSTEALSGSAVSPSQPWCCAGNEESGGGSCGSPGSTAAPVCDRLKNFFNDVAGEPIPDSLMLLADRLERALERGELSGLSADGRPR